jgi:hypothetical protein
MLDAGTRPRGHLTVNALQGEPSVSTDDSFLTMARWAAMRCTPRASTTDRIAGRPSGTAATASETPSSRTSTRSLGSRMSEVSRIAATTTTAMAAITIASNGTPSAPSSTQATKDTTMAASSR